MSSENFFEISPTDNSALDLLWSRNGSNALRPTTWYAVGPGTIEFDRRDYKLLLVVSRRVYLENTALTESVHKSASYTILDNSLVSPNVIQPIEGLKSYQYGIDGSSGPLVDTFYRPAYIVENGLYIGDCQLMHGTFGATFNLNNLVIPCQIYGIR